INIDGSLLVWGSNECGKLGDGTVSVIGASRIDLIENNNKSTPLKIMDGIKLARNEIKVLVNGAELSFDQPPIIYDNRTLVPVRMIFEALGAEVFWEQSIQTVTAVKEESTITLTIGNNTMTKDGEEIFLDVPAMIVGGRTLVPVRAIAESFGSEVLWNQNTKTVTITAYDIDTEPEQEKLSLNDPSLAGKKVPILMYHAIADAPTTSLTNLFVRPKELEAQLNYIAENGYQSITFEDLDSISTFSKPIMLTFDDGYKDNYTILFPLLQKYNIKATIFVVTGAVWSEGRLSQEDIVEMSDSGLVSIQSHTKNHYSLTSLRREMLLDELSSSKDYIEELTGKPVMALCYPEGAVNATVRAVAADYYSFAVLNTGGMFSCGGNTMTMNRIRISRGLSLNAFASLIK
ncbi:MAG: stalk domain-containing protein, partial [Clostridiales bacterium]|nr:stalk domain-containing protein [Clostridiales bacterium]